MWKKLTVNQLRQTLAEDEITALDTISLDPEKVNEIIQEQLNTVADAFRGALSGKGYKLDIREGYLPGAYVLYALTLARYYIWTRFPMSPSIALDEARKTLFENAQKQLESPTLGVEKPEWQYDPDNPENQNGQRGLPAVVLPYLRFDEELIWWNAISAM